MILCNIKMNNMNSCDVMVELRLQLMFQPIALKMGLNTSNLSSLWKDKALLEMNVAIMHSFQVYEWFSMDVFRPVNFRLRLAVLTFSQIFGLIAPKFYWKIKRHQFTFFVKVLSLEIGHGSWNSPQLNQQWLHGKDLEKFCCLFSNALTWPVFLIVDTFFHAEAGIVLDLIVNFEPNWASCSYKIVLIKKCHVKPHQCIRSASQVDGALVCESAAFFDS